MAMGTCPWCGRKVDKVIMFRGDIVGCRYCGIHTKQTNADHIRSMTDEELKKWFCNAHPNTCSGCPFEGIECTMLDWLKQEASE